MIFLGFCVFTWRVDKVSKIKLSRYRPEQADGRSGRLRPRIFLTFGTRRWYVVRLTHRPALLPGVSWYSFLEAESTPGHMVPSVAPEV
jgi:hypothetical protein